MKLKASELLSDKARGLLTTPSTAGEIRDEYLRMGVVQVDGFLRSQQALEFGELMCEKLSSLYQVSEYAHDFVKLRGGGKVLTSGYRFGRVDPTFGQKDVKRREAIEHVFEEIGFKSLSSSLGKDLESFVRYVISKDVTFKYGYCFIYKEGDYIGPHNDAQTGDRVNVQFPIALDAASGFRVLGEDGRFQLYYDRIGCVRILGPEVWHEVLPVLRIGEKSPRRILISLRYS